MPVPMQQKRKRASTAIVNYTRGDPPIKKYTMCKFVKIWLKACTVKNQLVCLGGTVYLRPSTNNI